MAGTASRRVFGLLVAIAFGALPSALQPLPAAASTANGTLFALGPTIVAKADPITGALTTFANLPLTPPTQPFPAFNDLASDSVGHRLFTVRTTYAAFGLSSVSYQLITIDTRTAAISISPDLGQSINGLVFDSSSASLYGYNNSCCPFQVLRIDPATGAVTHFADLPGVLQSRMAVAPAKHSIYIVTMSFVLGQPQPVFSMLTLDTSTAAITVGPTISIGSFALAYDTSSGTLFGKTFCCPANLVSIDPNTGAETVISHTDMGLGSGFAIDSASHTIFATQDVLGAFSFNQDILSMNDQTGASSISGPLPTNTYVGALAFEGIAITPDSIRTDVRTARASGAIDNGGIANSLLVKLNAAAADRAAGRCSAAAKHYNAFIHEVNAQSGKHIAAATASKLATEAQFLIANCP